MTLGFARTLLLSLMLVFTHAVSAKDEKTNK